jgi:hypothetical protein
MKALAGDTTSEMKAALYDEMLWEVRWNRFFVEEVMPY